MGTAILDSPLPQVANTFSIDLAARNLSDPHLGNMSWVQKSGKGTEMVNRHKDLHFWSLASSI